MTADKITLIRRIRDKLNKMMQAPGDEELIYRIACVLNISVEEKKRKE